MDLKVDPKILGTIQLKPHLHISQIHRKHLILQRIEDAVVNLPGQ